MPLSIGFDTLIANNRRYSEDELSDLFSLFVPLDVKNFIFLCEFDLVSDSFHKANEKTSLLKDRLSRTAPRGVHANVKYELIFDRGAPDNPQLSRLFASRAKRSLFVSLPMFPQVDDNSFATDLNRLIYRSNSFPIFTSFHNLVETAPLAFTSKLMTTDAGFAFDLNYLLRTDHPTLTERLFDVRVLPMISHDIANYVGIVNEISYFQEIFGKKQYYRLCSQINRCCTIADI